MLSFPPYFRQLVEKIIHLNAHERLLVVTDNYPRSLFIANAVAAAAQEVGSEATIAIMAARQHSGHEPPPELAAAMLKAHVIFHVAEGYLIDHTDARQRASEAGARFYETVSELTEDYFAREFTDGDLDQMVRRSERLAEVLSQAERVTVRSAAGTDLTMSVRGRPGLSIHPLSASSISVVPDYAEAAVCPLEGTTEGVLAVDGSVQGWKYVLPEPIRCRVERGRVTQVYEGRADVARFLRILDADVNARNCVAELGIGTSHTVPAGLRGWVWDYAALGTAHVAVGRNVDIGGNTHSRIHNDCLMVRPTIEVDGVTILHDGDLRV